jgi:Crp-like helix-turn-helix domain
LQRQHCVSMGQRNAFERIAHLFCETFVRALAAGIAHADGCEFPLTQADIADATGLTAVHVNRTIQLLRKEGLVRLTYRRLFIPDLPRLARAGLFDPIAIAAPGVDASTAQPGPAQRAFAPEALQLA